MVQLFHLYVTTGKTIALIVWTFVSKVMSLLFNMLSMFVRAFLPRSKHLLISWLHIHSDVRAQERKISHYRLQVTLPLGEKLTHLGGKTSFIVQMETQTNCSFNKDPVSGATAFQESLPV